MSDISGINGTSGYSLFDSSSSFSGAPSKTGASNFDSLFDIQDPTYTSFTNTQDPNKQSSSDSSLSDLSNLWSQLMAILSKLFGNLFGGSNKQDDFSSFSEGDIQDPPPAYTEGGSPSPYTPPSGASGDGTNTPSPDPTPVSHSSSGSDGASGDFDSKMPTGLNSDQQTKDMEKNLVKAFMDKGLTYNQAVGVVASLKEESGLNTAIRQGGAYDTDPDSKADVVNQTGFGLAQWGEDRLQNLKTYASDHGLPPSSQAAQVGFMMQEAESMGILDKIKNGPDDASAACATWTTDYEIAAAPNMDTRMSYISQVENDTKGMV
jgi:hypothetical protein